MRPTPFRPATTPEDARERARRWNNGEYDAVASLQEVLGFSDAEMETWKRTGTVPPPRHPPQRRDTAA